MPTKVPVKDPSALHEILEWSATRPDWQRDALRRIVIHSVISDDDLAKLDRICRAKHGADSSKEPALSADPLAASHLPSGPGVAESISLASVGLLLHVNRIPSDQVMPFGASPGLTVVYGNNGSGKSGYARVLKKACRARGAPPAIHANVLVAASGAPATASIVIRVDGKETPLSWTDGVASDPRLANVFVFDGSSAAHYLSEDGSTSFTPYGLDVLPMLSKTCDAIGARIQKDIDTIDAVIAAVAAGWKFDSTTKVGMFVAKLSANSKRSEVDSLAGLDSAQVKRLQDLREALVADPVQKAKDTRAAASRVREYGLRVSACGDVIGDEAVETLREQVDQVNAAEVAAKAYAEGTFDQSFLAGTGSALWRAMWEAARHFSISDAYKEEDFPYLGDSARCLLCQQDIEGAAAERLGAFEAFCKDASQLLAKDATARVATSSAALEQVSALGLALESLDADFANLEVSERASVADFVVAADARLVVLKNNVLTRSWTAPSVLPASPSARINQLSTSLEERAKTEESAQDPANRAMLMAERAELEVREWLFGVKKDVLEQIRRFEVIRDLKKCQRDTTTVAITTQSIQLTKAFVTDAFCHAFEQEVKNLGLRSLLVQLDPIQGKKGETKFGLRLVSAPQRKVLEIASDGEQRCVALAAFFAELCQASHQSALVFDDPVSSLDQCYRERIATRLVTEAASRQVIVFTHDVAFLTELLARSTNGKVSPQVLTLEWHDDAPGSVVKGLPWDTMPPLERLKELRGEQKAIAKVWNPLPNDANVREMRSIYSRLRATLERIVEKDLLGGIVSRSKAQIVTGRIAHVAAIPVAECDETLRLIQRCHEVTDAHDVAPGKDALVPDPVELTIDLKATEELLATIRKRKTLAGL